MNGNIEKAVKRCPTCLYYQVIQPKDKVMLHKKPGRPWDYVRADIFKINNKHYLCILDYHIKFPGIKQVEGFNADSLIK